MENSPALFTNLILFVRVLRELGLNIDSQRILDALDALKQAGLGREDVYHILRGLFVLRKEEGALFDQAFDLFWRAPSQLPKNTRSSVRVVVSPSARIGGQALTGAPPKNGAHPPLEENGGAQDSPFSQSVLTYSSQELLRKKDFAELTPAELEQVSRLLASLDWRLGERKTRRFHSGNGPRLDLRRTLRGSLRYGGEVLDWQRQRPLTKPRPIVILADISGSMERYTRMLLQLTYGLNRQRERRVEVFVFGTRLTRITHPLSLKDAGLAFQQVKRLVPDWSGGTRIGEALAAFNYAWGRRVLGHGALVLLISDGWDCGVPAQLRSEIARLQRSCSRLIWLNPLLGAAGYEPLTRGMQAALPYIDDFLPVHNLVSLENLAAHLRGLDASRAPRRQVGLK